MQNPSLYLASQSPRRRELLAQVGVTFDVISSSVQEQRQMHESPERYVQRLAKDKALAGQAVAVDQSLPVLGADTIVVKGQNVLEKPLSEQHACDMLMVLSGGDHQVMSAICICRGDEIETRLSITRVSFRDIGQAEAQRYWKTGEPLDKAGGYAIQGLGALFVTALEGSYSNVVGLPLEQLYGLLQRFAIPYWQILRLTEDDRSP